MVFSNSYFIKSLYILKVTDSGQELDCSTQVLNWTFIFISIEGSTQARRAKSSYGGSQSQLPPPTSINDLGICFRWVVLFYMQVVCPH